MGIARLRARSRIEERRFGDIVFGSPEDGLDADRKVADRMSAAIPIADTTHTIRTATFLEISLRRLCFSSGVFEGTSTLPLLCSRVLYTGNSDPAVDGDETPPFCVSAGW